MGEGRGTKEKWKEEEEGIRVDLYEFCLSYIIYFLIYYFMTILTTSPPRQICGISHTRGKEFRDY